MTHLAYKIQAVRESVLQFQAVRECFLKFLIEKERLPVRDVVIVESLYAHKVVVHMLTLKNAPAMSIHEPINIQLAANNLEARHMIDDCIKRLGEQYRNLMIHCTSERQL